MSDEIDNKPSTWFWVIGVVALLWNLLGVAAYLAQVFMTEADLAAKPEAERLLYETVPAWATGAFALAVFAGALGCVFLLIRKNWAIPVFIASLIGIVVQMIYNVFMSKALEVYGPGGVIMPIMVLLIGVFLIFYARRSAAKGWLV